MKFAETGAFTLRVGRILCYWARNGLSAAFGELTVYMDSCFYFWQALFFPESNSECDAALMWRNLFEVEGRFSGHDP
jgi:hypothetical protein